MNKKIAMSAMSIFSALTIMGGATFAAFTSTDSNVGNTFSTGTLVMEVNNSTGTSDNIFTSVNASGMAPGEFVEDRLVFKNTGSIDASKLRIVSLEKTSGTGGFEGQIDVFFWDDTNNNGVFEGGETSLGSGKLNDAGWNNYQLPGIILPATEPDTERSIGVRLTLDPTTPDAFQNATITFNMNFIAEQ